MQIWRKNSKGNAVQTMDNNTMRKLIKQADTRTLEELILRQCREDERFYLKTLSYLGGSPEDEFFAVKNLVEASVERNVYRGQLNKPGCANICKDMMAALHGAQRRMERKQYAQAMDIAWYILRSCIDLINRTGNTSDSVWDIFGSSSNILDRCTRAVQQTGSVEEKHRQAVRILQIVKAPEILPWSDLRCDLLEQVLPLADEKCAEEILALLKQKS